MKLIKIEDDLKILVVGLKKLLFKDPIELIHRLRDRYKDLIIQVVDPRYLAGYEHIENVAKQTISAERKGLLLADRPEVDLILRIACTRQISDAVKDVGVRPESCEIALIAIGHHNQLSILESRLSRLGISDDRLIRLNRRKEEFLKKHHSISNRMIESTIGFPSPLSRILSERSALLRPK